jgi:hypothetical protein
MEILTAVDQREVVSDKLCAVYDEDTREVLHFHRTVTLEGGKVPNDAAVRSQAMKQARALGHMRGRKVAVAAVDPEGFQPGCSHTVDPKEPRLIATPVAASENEWEQGRA